MESARNVTHSQEHRADPNPITRPIEVRSAIFREGTNVTRLLNAVRVEGKSIFSAMRPSGRRTRCQPPLFPIRRSASLRIICQEARYPRIAELPVSSNFQPRVRLFRLRAASIYPRRNTLLETIQRSYLEANFQYGCSANKISFPSRPRKFIWSSDKVQAPRGSTMLSLCELFWRCCLTGD